MTSPPTGCEALRDEWSIVQLGLKIAEFFVFFAAIAAIIAYLLMFGFSHLYDVAIGREGLDIVAFRKIVIATIPYSSIERAERRWIFLSNDASVAWSVALPITNRVGLRSVIIKLKRRIGIFRYIQSRQKTRYTFWRSFGGMSRYLAETFVHARRTR